MSGIVPTVRVFKRRVFSPGAALLQHEGAVPIALRGAKFFSFWSCPPRLTALFFSAMPGDIMPAPTICRRAARHRRDTWWGTTRMSPSCYDPSPTRNCFAVEQDRWTSVQRKREHDVVGGQRRAVMEGSRPAGCRRTGCRIGWPQLDGEAGSSFRSLARRSHSGS